MYGFMKHTILSLQKNLHATMETVFWFIQLLQRFKQTYTFNK